MKCHFLKQFVAIVMIACLPLSLCAEELKLGEFITYYGKVDGNGVPYGKGKIETIYGNSDPNPLAAKDKDVLEGVFENGTVKDAKLLLHRYNGPLWINSAKYKGAVEYSIAKDGSSITYQLTNGKFETNSFTTFEIKPECPLILIRTPHKDGCDLNASVLYIPNNSASVKVEDINSSVFYPLQLSDLGDIKQISQVNSYSLDSEFKEHSNGVDYIILTANGGVLSKTKDGLNYVLSNKDYFRISKEANIAFKKTFKEGVLICNNVNCYQFIENNGDKGIVLKNTNESAQNVFNKVMKSTSIQETGYKLYLGKIATLIEQSISGDGQAQYDLAMAYMKGDGIEQNDENSQYWLRLAEKNGNEKAVAYLREKENKRNEFASSLSPIGKWTDVKCSNSMYEHSFVSITRNECQCVWQFNANHIVRTTSHINYIEDRIDNTRVRIYYSMSCDFGTWKKVGDKIVVESYPNRRNCKIEELKIHNLDDYSISFQQKIKAFIPNVKKEILSYNKYDQISCTATMISPEEMNLIMKWQNPYTNRKDIYSHVFTLKRDTEGMNAVQKAQLEKQMSQWNELK